MSIESLASESLVHILDMNFMDLQRGITTGMDRHYIEWKTGRIEGMIVAGRICGHLAPEASFQLEEIVSGWGEQA